MTRTRRFLSGLGAGYLNMAVVTLVGLWLTTFYLRALGQRDYGLWLVVAQVLAYIGLLDLGNIALLPREVAYASGQPPDGQPGRPADAAAETLTLALWQVPLVILAGLGVLLLLPGDWSPLRGPLALVLVTYVVTYPLRIFHGLLRGLQDLAFIGIAQTVSWAVGTIVGVALVLAGLGLYALAAGWVAAQVAAPLLWWLRLRQRFPDTLPGRPARLHRPALTRRLVAGGWVSMSQVAQVLVAGTDLLIIGRLLGPGTVVLYFCTAKLISVLANQPQLILDAAQPGLAQMRTSETRERLAAACGALTQGMLILSGVVACVVLAVNQGFVSWWVGADRYGGAVLTVTLLAAMLLRHWSTTAAYALFALGRERRIAVTTLGQGLTTVATQILLVRAIGPLGAALGSLIGVALVGLPANLVALGEEIGGFPGVLRPLGPWAWRFGLVAGVAALVATTWQPTAIGGIAALTLAIGALYGITFLPLVLRGTLATYVHPQLARLRAALLGAGA